MKNNLTKPFEGMEQIAAAKLYQESKESVVFSFKDGLHNDLVLDMVYAMWKTLFHRNKNIQITFINNFVELNKKTFQGNIDNNYEAYIKNNLYYVNKSDYAAAFNSALDLIKQSFLQITEADKKIEVIS